jgi:hypothetical protein
VDVSSLPENPVMMMMTMMMMMMMLES